MGGYISVYSSGQEGAGDKEVEGDQLGIGPQGVDELGERVAAETGVDEDRAGVGGVESVGCVAR